MEQKKSILMSDNGQKTNGLSVRGGYYVEICIV